MQLGATHFFALLFAPCLQSSASAASRCASAAAFFWAAASAFRACPAAFFSFTPPFLPAIAKSYFCGVTEDLHRCCAAAQADKSPHA
jgi:hypothetical protein